MMTSRFANTERLLLCLLLAALLVAGVSMGWQANYGGDIDAYGLLHSFHAVLDHGVYVPSRFTGYPVAEVVIGTLDYWGGSGLVNVSCLALTALALVFAAAASGLNATQRLWLLVLGLSNHVLFFESLQAMDYPVALVLLCTGWVLLSRGFLVLAVLAFGASCGARPNFIVFALMLVLFSDQSGRLRMEQMLSLVVVAALFYVPVWMHSHFGFDWINAERSDTRLSATLVRFFYKSYLVLGLPAWLLVLAGLRHWRPVLLASPVTVRAQMLALIAGNAAVFYFLPAEPAYLQPAILALLVLLVPAASSAWRLALLFANLSVWLCQVQFLQVSYRNQDPCKPVIAVAAKAVMQAGPGALSAFQLRQSREYCFIHKIHD